jgi:hypothetical protein
MSSGQVNRRDTGFFQRLNDNQIVSVTAKVVTLRGVMINDVGLSDLGRISRTPNGLNAVLFSRRDFV